MALRHSPIGYVGLCSSSRIFDYLTWLSTESAAIQLIRAAIYWPAGLFELSAEFERLGVGL